MSSTISQRLALLREWMRREHLEAFIFPSSDPHASEYVAPHWKGREWISGFNGSAGTAVVTLTAAALWTDSRYFLAAEEQLSGTEFQLMKLKIAGTPSIPDWIEANTTVGSEVGIDGTVCSVAFATALIADMHARGGYTVRVNSDPLKTIWQDRPAIPLEPVRLHPMEYSGEAATSKLARIRQALREKHADGMLMSALDDIAWTLNLRGNDVECNPVFIAYLVIEPSKATLFVDSRKLSAEVRTYLDGVAVTVKPYEEVANYLLNEYFAYNILMDPDETNIYLHRLFPNNRRVQHIVEEKSPVPALKAVKNEAEIAGFRQAMLRDGIAMVRFLRWLKPAVEAGGQTELSVAEKLRSLRAEQPLYEGLSFETISAYAAHGAIVHYEPTPESDIPLEPRGLLLLDSGAQYTDGTTDITRNIALGPLTEEERHVYTLVLKAHIQLELAQFPDGACGTQVDALAREPLWREGLNFLHGTGHGVGSNLCVHEGPHQIRMEYMPAPLHAGMTVTDEPGIYLAGRFGVRIENTCLIVPRQETEFGKFLGLEPLTLCPFDLAPVQMELLTEEEKDWLNKYHQNVLSQLSPYLSADDLEWLKSQTKAV